jgi:lipopolysaccharide transport system ATP-binding protein
MNSAIRATNLSKQYRLGALAGGLTLRDTLGETLRAPLQKLRRRLVQPDHSVWALHEVNFTIETGEAVGIIGRNGAGKSTLLKILSQITEPTSGRVELYAKPSSLLEVGTGFHPELTGRENVFLNGAILGMKKADIARKFDEIVAFAEIEKFIDTAVKFYSSGMYVRLAFAVAAHLEPEIMIIDEVLAVGDMAFQQKCVQKMNEMRARTKAIIFVSHSMFAVRATCSRVMFMKDGRLAADGTADEVIPIYEQVLTEQSEGPKVRDEVAEGMGSVQINALRLVDHQRAEKTTFEIGEKVTVVIEYEAVDPVKNVIVYAAIRRLDDVICVASSTRLEGIPLPRLEGPGLIEIEIPELVVIPGRYVMDVVFYDENYDYRVYFLGRKRIEFGVASTQKALNGMYGFFYQKQNWRIMSHSNGVSSETPPPVSLAD